MRDLKIRGNKVLLLIKLKILLRKLKSFWKNSSKTYDKYNLERDKQSKKYCDEKSLKCCPIVTELER